MKVYILEHISDDYECSFSEIVKVFAKKEDAETYKNILEEESQSLINELKELREKHHKETEHLWKLHRSKKISEEQRTELSFLINKETTEHLEVSKKYKNVQFHINNPETEYFSINEMEVE